MSKFIQDTESIEKLLDHIESKMRIDDTNHIMKQTEGSHEIERYNYTKKDRFTGTDLIERNKQNRSHSNNTRSSNHEITELFKKILEADSSYKYIDMSELPDLTHRDDLETKPNTSSMFRKSRNSNVGKTMSSTLDMIEELSESLKNAPDVKSINTQIIHKNPELNNRIFTRSPSDSVRCAKLKPINQSDTHNHTNYGLSEVFMPSKK